MYLQRKFKEGRDERKVFHSGNSVVIALPKDALELLGVSEGSDVSIDFDPVKRQVILSQASESLAGVGVDEEFARQVAEFIHQIDILMTR